MSIAIHPFSAAHYSIYTVLWNEAYPELSRTELELRLADLSTGTASTRWVAEYEGEVVAIGGYEPLEAEQFHPLKFQMHLIVRSDCRQKGIGGSLYRRIAEELDRTRAQQVRVWVREDRSESLRFFVARGFVEEMRTLHSSLDLSAFDVSRFAKFGERLKRNAYKFATFADLVGDPERNRKTHELYCEVMREIPSAEPPQLPSFSEYERKIAANPESFRGHFIAMRSDEYVGLCILLPKDRDRCEFYADTLGVKREYRGRGIAQALSACAIEYAKSRGYSVISADNFRENVRIIPLLRALGFSNESGWTLFSKTLIY